MHVVFRPSDDTASLISMILSMTLLEYQEYFQKPLSVNTIRRAIKRCQQKLYRAKRNPYVNMVQRRCRVLLANVFYGQTSPNLTFFLEMNEWMMHLYSTLCIFVHPKRFTIMCVCVGGVSPQPSPVCSIHLDDATAATGQRRQCAHHTPATGGEERESHWVNQVDGDY